MELPCFSCPFLYATAALAGTLPFAGTDRPRSDMERDAASSTRTTRNPASPSVIGVLPFTMKSAKCLGERDLYVSFWVGGEATEPVNMGNVINSNLDESSPYLCPDKKTLYFASKGHNGYGGFDIYVTQRLDETWTNWSTPENLGPVINGPMDEEFFVVTHCKKYGYFSKQVAANNTDIFKVSMAELFAGYTALFR